MTRRPITSKRRSGAGRSRPKRGDATPHKKRAPRRVHSGGPHIRWSKLNPMYDSSGEEFRRFFNLETLANATEKQISEHRGVVVSCIRRLLDPSPIATLDFELFQEGGYQLIFKVRATNINQRKATFSLVVAKNGAELSNVAKAVHDNLLSLNKRAPKLVVKPYTADTIYLPDRHRRKEHDREIYAYTTEWPGGYHELGVGRNHQFFMNTTKRHVFSRQETERLKQRMIEIIVRTYDPVRHECMVMPQITSGDFVVTAPRGAPPRLKLIACRNISRRMTPAKVIDQIAGEKWNWAGRPLRLLPANPADLFEAITNALGKKGASNWLSAYTEGVARKKFHQRRALPLALLRDAGYGPR